MSEYYIDILYFFSSLVLLAFARFLYSIFHTATNYYEQLGTRKNTAFATAISGYLIACAIVISGAVDKSLPIQEGLFELAVFGFGGIICINLSDIILDWLQIPNADSKRDIEQKVLGSGIIQFSFYIAIAMMIYASSIAFHESYFGGLGWLLGILTIVLLHLYYIKVLSNPLEVKNMGSVLAYTGVILSTGILFSNALSHGFEDFTDLFYIFLITLFWIMIIIPVFELLLFKVMIFKLDKKYIEEEPKPLVIGLLQCFTYIGVTTLLALSFYP